jgi:hypothetical protein
MKREPLLMNSVTAVSEGRIAVRSEGASWRMINILRKNLFE